MTPETSPLETLTDIKKMMEKSSRFISLSGWSGVAAGLCGLAGALVTHQKVEEFSTSGSFDIVSRISLARTLTMIAGAVFILAFVMAFLFTYLRSRKEGIPVWSNTSKRLMWNTIIPMAVGGLVILRLLQTEGYDLIAPCMLIFYGLALINGSKYTLGEIRYMGYMEIVLGILNLWYPELWLIFLAIGFGILHIIYGSIMWWNHERA